MGTTRNFLFSAFAYNICGCVSVCVLDGVGCVNACVWGGLCVRCVCVCRCDYVALHIHVEVELSCLLSYCIISHLL